MNGNEEQRQRKYLVGRSGVLPYHLARIGVHMQTTHKFLFLQEIFRTVSRQVFLQKFRAYLDIV